MTKRTIYCESPSYIKMKNKQLYIEFKDKLTPDSTVPIEDIAVLIIDNNQIVITSALIQELQNNKVAFMVCDSTHMPTGLMLPIDGNSIQQERINLQININQSSKNDLWKQIITKKIDNQSSVLNFLSINSIKLKILSENIKPGDKTNREAHASVYYWKNIFKDYTEHFKRDSDGRSPNNFLNYGYTILRSIMARNIVAAGLSPSIGVFHKNQYNAFCLADDLMEPFRPFVDKIVYEMISKNGLNEFMTKENRKILLQITTLEVISKKETTSLTIATQNMVNSYVKFLNKEQDELDFPEFIK
jgi:CRISPR-associated protein Cas1